MHNKTGKEHKRHKKEHKKHKNGFAPYTLVLLVSALCLLCSFPVPLGPARAAKPPAAYRQEANLRAIFISYRRNDSEGEAGRLFDDLIDSFGDHSVFMDVAAIQPGRDFRIAIDASIAECSVLLTLIGQSWLESKDALGQRRLDDRNDFVRLEIASALKRDIAVVPVLVRGARMPRAEQLPPDLRDLAYRNAVELTHARWKSDVQILIKALSPHVGSPASGPSFPAERKDESETAAPAINIEPAAAAGVGRELARYIGPIAEIVVKRAAKRCSSLAGLCAEVAQEIESPADRDKFLASCRRLQSAFTARPTS